MCRCKKLGRDVVLIGEFNCYLCCDCSNLFREYILKNPEYKLLMETKDQLRALEIAAQSSEYTTDFVFNKHMMLASKIRNLLGALYEESKRWYNANP